MKILYLLSNRRWTGPAEPAVSLAAALHEAKWDITFSCGKQRIGRENRILKNAQKQGVLTRTGLGLKKHHSPLRNWEDARILHRWLFDDGFQIVHTHLRNAHLITAWATCRMAKKPLIIRTCYDGDGPTGFRERYLLRNHTDGLMVVSEMARRRVVENYGFPKDRVWTIHPPIDLLRFDPERGLGHRRIDFGITPYAFVVGIIARIQRHRRFDVFLKAIDLARHELPNLRVLIVGRGSNRKPVAIDPIHRMGLEDTVVMPGYHTGDDFVRTIATMDAKVFLVPGSDGSCRAVRECMAMGVPIIAARRGILPELVGDGDHGLVIDDTPENLSRAIITLARDPRHRKEMGHRARQYARAHFSLSQQAAVVGGIYKDLVKRGPR